MAGFWTGVTGWQKIIFVFGGFAALIAATVLFPDAFQRLADTARGFFDSAAQLFQGE